jgi:GxxExxY protein
MGNSARRGYVVNQEMVHAKPRSREDEIELEEVARIVVDQAFKLHQNLGPGLLESVYEIVLSRALERAGLKVERQKTITIQYDGMEFSDAFRLDLLVDNRLVVEIKSVEILNKAHSKQLLTYLRLIHQPIGLLINFGSASFREGIKRVVNSHTNFAASRLRVNQSFSGEGK